MVISLIAVIVAVGAFFLGRKFAPKVEVPTPPIGTTVLANEGHRCHTITYTFSDGSKRVFHSCQGHTEFTDRFGHGIAPAGATLLSARGGVHV